MNKLLQSQRIKSLILFIFETCAVAALFLCTWLLEFDYYLEISIASLVFFAALNTLFFWYCSVVIQRRKQMTELQSADIIGSDIQEAYNFGKVGLIVTNPEGTVLWVNEFLYDMKFQVVDRNIDNISPDLLKLSDDSYEDDSVTIFYQNHYYEVKFIKAANLYIFKDVSDYESIFTYSKNQAPVVGFILIDNFSDVSSGTEETVFNDMASAVRKQIASYCKKYQALCRRLRSDMYIFICSYENYEKMRHDNFSLVDSVRELYTDGFTLSVGVAYGFPDYNKLSDLASNAIDVALSRGGDQTVIAPFSENMVFIGGKTESKASRNKVKIRTLSQSLVTLMQHSSKVLIIGHIYADTDAVGAAFGVKAIADFAKVEAKVLYDEQLVESKTRRAVKLLFTSQELKDCLIGFKAAHEYIDDNTLIVAVDFNNPNLALNTTLIDEKTKLAVIDHHRRADSFFPNVVFNGIDPSASSTCELIAGYISYNQNKINLSDKTATLMLAGILVDTNYYRNKTNIGTYEASTILKQYGANNEQADDFLKEDYEEYTLKNKILSNSITPYYGTIVCRADDEDIIDRTVLAIVAREATSIRGVNVSFVIGRSEEKSVRISARSDGTVNCQLIMEKLGGGGHFNSAAAEFVGSEFTVEIIENKLLHILDQYLNEARSDTKKV